MSESNVQPDWVIVAFNINYFQWIDQHIRVLMVGLNASTERNLKIGAMGTLAGGGFAGYHMDQNAYIGDYIDMTNGKILLEKKVKKYNKIFEDENER